MKSFKEYLSEQKLPTKYTLVVTEKEYQDITKARMGGRLSFKYTASADQVDTHYYDPTKKSSETGQYSGYHPTKGREVTFTGVTEPYKLAKQLDAILDFDAISAAEALNLPTRYMK